MKKFQNFELKNSEIIFGGRLWRTSRGSDGNADLYDDEKHEIYIIEG